MKLLPLLLIASAIFASSASAREVLAEDDASQSIYNEGWRSVNAGSGFAAWTFKNEAPGEEQSHSGFFIASIDDNPDLTGAQIQKKAFGLFANGTAFEKAAAFRSFNQPLQAGDTFSFLFEHSAIVKKFETDDAGTGSIGLTLRAGNDSSSADSYNTGARFEFGFYESLANYFVYDGEENHDTGVAWTDGGISVTVTLTSPDTYDLEIVTLEDKQTHSLKGRKLGGGAGERIESLCVFDRDGEKADAFFNGFQVTR